MRVRSLLFVWLAGLVPAWAAAADKLAGEALPKLGPEGLLTTAGGLALVLGLILGAGWLLKRVGNLPSSGRGLVKVLGGVSLGARERVVVIEIEDTRLVLGVTPGQVHTLHVLPATSEFERSLDEAGGPKP